MQANGQRPFQCFGQQLLLDAYDCDSNLLNDEIVIYNFLDQLPNLISMTKMILPQVHRCNTGKEEDYGLSGFCIIQESHISIHNFYLKNYLSCDIFSCKPFDTNIAIDYIKKTFGVKGKMEINLLNRGLEFPRNITIVKNIIIRQRAEL